MPPHTSTDFAMVEDLTSRELEILTQFADRRSDREIAENLMLSLNTVKWYARQIYGKLGVNNRRMAVLRAQKYGLLAGVAPSPIQQSTFPTFLTSVPGT